MPITRIPKDAHSAFNAYNATTAIFIQNYVPQPIRGVPAKYVVYETRDPRNVLGAGTCLPRPNTARVRIPADLAFTVQALENDLSVTYP